MKRVRNFFTGRGWVALVVLPVAVVLGAGTAVRTLAAPLLVNESPSLPTGLYWRAFGDRPRPGSIVAIAQPLRAQSYLVDLGFPADVLLIKRVAAVGGQFVCVQDGGLRTPTGHYRVRHRDRHGRALPGWTGCRRLRADELFLMGDTDTSFDSRNFGPVRRRDVVGVYREGLRW